MTTRRRVSGTTPTGSGGCTNAGYTGISWPRGLQRAATLRRASSWSSSREPTRARAPYVGVNFVGTLHCGPTLIAEGTDEQKRAHLPKILRGDEVWCQCFSEPDAGSDLAQGLAHVMLDGDHYVVTGPEDLVLLRSCRRLRRAARTHRSRRPQAPRDHVADPADGPAGHRRAPHRDRARVGTTSPSVASSPTSSPRTLRMRCGRSRSATCRRPGAPASPAPGR